MEAEIRKWLLRIKANEEDKMEFYERALAEEKLKALKLEKQLEEDKTSWAIKEKGSTPYFAFGTNAPWIDEKM